MKLSHRPTTFRPGDLFERQYEVLGLLGAGGHGRVYHCRDILMGREVAIKTVPSPRADLRDRAIREARLLGKLAHPNVVGVQGCATTADGSVYIVMELLVGRTLRDALSEFRALRVEEALLVSLQIAKGVQAAHEHQTIHRDLKPENAFVQEANLIRVIDFGIAKFSDKHTTRRDVVQGTVYYMSPEQLHGLTATPRSDIFALGAILYELIAGCPPAIVGMTRINLNDVLWNQLNKMPPRLDELIPHVPSYVGRMVHRMAATRPHDRYADMAEVIDVCSRYLARYQAETPNRPPVRQLWIPGRGGRSPQQAKALGEGVVVAQSNTEPAVCGPALGLAAATARYENIQDSIPPLAFPTPDRPSVSTRAHEAVAVTAVPTSITEETRPSWSRERPSTVTESLFLPEIALETRTDPGRALVIKPSAPGPEAPSAQAPKGRPRLTLVLANRLAVSAGAMVVEHFVRIGRLGKRKFARGKAAAQVSGARRSVTAIGVVSVLAGATLAWTLRSSSSATPAAALPSTKPNESAELTRYGWPREQVAVHAHGLGRAESVPAREPSAGVSSVSVAPAQAPVTVRETQPAKMLPLVSTTKPTPAKPLPAAPRPSPRPPNLSLLVLSGLEPASPVPTTSSKSPAALATPAASGASVSTRPLGTSARNAPELVRKSAPPRGKLPEQPKRKPVFGVEDLD